MNVYTTCKNLCKNFCTALMALLLLACADSKSVEIEMTKLDSLSSLVSKNYPQTALSVREAIQLLKVGDSATVRGQIGGKRHPFFSSFAGFILTDIEVLFCNEIEEDHCETPWDACCEDTDTLKSSRASVTFVDADGFPIPSGIEGVEGLKGLDVVTVDGFIAKGSTKNNLLIEATSLYRE